MPEPRDTNDGTTTCENNRPRERCNTCGGHGHDPSIECMHGDVEGVCFDDLCQDGDNCPACDGSGWES